MASRWQMVALADMQSYFCAGVLHPGRLQVPRPGACTAPQPSQQHPGGLALPGLPVLPPRIRSHGALTPPAVLHTPTTRILGLGS